MLVKRANFALLALLLGAVLPIAGCSNGCASPFKPLPEPLPSSQIVEGGVQVRVTKSGLKTITDTLKTVVNNTVGKDGVCIPQQSGLDPGTGLPFLNLCYDNGCDGGKGCKLTASVASLVTSIPDPGTFHADITLSAQTAVPLNAYYIVFGSVVNLGSCTFTGQISNLHALADIGIGIGANGELTLRLKNVDIQDFNLEIGGSTGICDFVGSVASFVSGIFKTFIGNWIVDLLTPALNTFVQGFLPKPLGVEGILDVGSLLSTILPGVSGEIELHGVPGGYASLPAQGISLGVNIGLNADRDRSTRAAGNASEPSLCVPQWSAPDLSAPPASLTKVPGRNTFRLNASGAFLGSPDPASDVAIGVSQTVLDLAGHHVIASGALCLSVSSSLAPQLNLGTVGILIPSLSELGQGKEPVLLALRPTAPVTFTIGEGSSASPYVTAHLKDLEIDFYTLLFEGYVRAFTVAASLDVGVNLEFMLDKDQHAVISPTLVGLDASKIKVKVSNTDFLRETPAQLEAVFPTLLNLVLPLISQALPDLPVPSFQGFTLGDLKLGHVTTQEDDFLAIYASLARASNKPQRRRVTTAARIVRVTAPPVAEIRSYLGAGDGRGALPEVELALDGRAADGAQLEWQWNLDGGMWRPFVRADRLVISDPAFALQGRHSIQVRARAVGDYETTDVDGIDLPVVIDSVAPRILPSTLQRDGDNYAVGAQDLVTEDGELRYAVGRVDSEVPATQWEASSGRFSSHDLADHAGRIRLYVKDEVGNIASAVLDLGAAAAAPPVEEAAGCAVARPRGNGGLALPLVALGSVLGLRALRRRRALLALLTAAACSSPEIVPDEESCMVDADCAAICPAGQVGTCATNGTGNRVCGCVEDIPIGQIGTHSNMALSTNGTAFVSAYNLTHGDLMVAELPAAGKVPASAWQFADGVPEGPVVFPTSKVRRGIRAAGDDVGLYTSIAVTPNGEPVVSHYDRTHASLRYAQRIGGNWASYVLDAGAPGSKDIGHYSAITVDAMGRPGVAYLAIITDGMNRRSEVRWVQASRAVPAALSDWNQSVIESKAMPPRQPIEDMLDDLPPANGLFVAAVRRPNGDPVVAYYDRLAGQLKLAEWEASAAAFKKPVVLDGGDSENVGLYPSLAVTPDGKIQVGYVDAQKETLLTVTYPGGLPRVVDDGYRTDGTTAGGIPRPVYHHVGNNNAIINDGKVSAIVYQDGTSQDLLLARPALVGWSRSVLAGSETPYKGAYGFYTSAALTSASELVVSTFALNQTSGEQWVEIFRQKLEAAPGFAPLDAVDE